MRWSVGLLLVLSTPALGQSRAARVPPIPATGFGAAVVLVGDERFVGRPGEALGLPMPPSQTGGIHVFRRGAGGAWAEQAVIAPADLAIGDGFALALATDGRVLVAGAFSQSGARGAAYVFERAAAGGTWRQSAKLTARDGAAGDSLGFAVALHGDVVLLGAPGHNRSRGAAYAFRRDARTGGWSQTAKLAAAAPDSAGRFGAALVLDAERALVGAPGPHFVPGLLSGPPQLKPGAVHAFRRPAAAGAWTEEARLTPASDSARAFGAALSLSGATLFVGAPGARTGAGAVSEYGRDRTTGAWQLRATFAPESLENFALFGATVAPTGTGVLAGAPMGEHGAGAVWYFRRDPATARWMNRQKMTVSALGFAPGFGSALAAHGDLAVISAPGADFFEGVGYAFQRETQPDQWRERGTIVDRPAGLAAVTGGEVSCESGKAGAFGCSEVDLLAFLPVSALGGKRGIMLNDLWGWTDPETGREIAIVGRNDGTTFVDVTNPTSPVYLGELPLTAGATPNLWRDMKVYKNHVFIVADGAGAHGMQVFDLTQLRNVRVPPVTFQETAHYSGIHSAHNIAINEETGFAYPIGSSMGGETCGGGLHMINIQEPGKPTFAGCWADTATGMAKTGYTHDAQCVTYRGPDVQYQGREVCFNASETAVGIADVTDKAAPKRIASASYPNVAYTHQGWLTPDHRYFLLDDELDEFGGAVSRTRTLVWDVTDLDDPVVLTEFLGTTAATDHNLYIKDRYVYQSNYVAGLRILDIADPRNPVEVGFFDTVPFGADVPGFAGSWSNYPFFQSGTVVVSSMKEGLFVLRKRQTPVVP